MKYPETDTDLAVKWLSLISIKECSQISEPTSPKKKKKGKKSAGLHVAEQQVSNLVFYAQSTITVISGLFPGVTHFVNTQ